VKALNINIKKILQAIVWLALAAGAVILLISAAGRKDQKECKGIEVNISGVSNNFFIDKNDVLKLIKKYSNGDMKGKPVLAFNLRKIEEELRKQVWIKNAELFFDNNDLLQAQIEEREPVARIFTINGSSFYIDSSTHRLPLSEKFSARLPVFTGFGSDLMVLTRKDSSILKQIRDISLSITADSFLVAMIEQVDIDAQGHFELVPKLGDQVILFGDGSDASIKLFKLKLFYRNVMSKAGWNKYRSIDLQFKDQVVAQVRGKQDVATDSARALQLMQQMVAYASRASADSLQLVIPENEKNLTDTSLIQQSLQRDEIAEPPISNSIEKPSPQEPVKTVTIKPVPASNPVKPSKSKPVVKPASQRQQQKPKAVMKSNDY